MNRIAAVIVTCRRPHELERLLKSLKNGIVAPAGCVVVDHSGDSEVLADLRREWSEVVWMEDPSNPGPGAGWKNGALRALETFSPDAILFLDDDVVMPPDGLKTLAENMGSAGAIAPLLEDEVGKLWGFPEPVPRDLRLAIRESVTPAEALQRMGSRSIPCCWATGACFLVRTSAIQSVGFHRTDFWMLGEDLEYSMRIAGTCGVVFTCRVAVPHLPPVRKDAAGAELAGRQKFQSLLQNLSYLAFASPHARHLWTYLPGNYRRYFRTYGWGPAVFGEALGCFWKGAVIGLPAGAGKIRR